MPKLKDNHRRIKIFQEILSFFLFFIWLGIIVLVILLPFRSISDSFRAAFGGIGILTIPGLFISYVFFSQEKLIQPLRIFFSLLMTLIFVPVAMYVLYLFDVKINFFTETLVSLFFIIVSSVYLVIHERQ